MRFKLQQVGPDNWAEAIEGAALTARCVREFDVPAERLFDALTSEAMYGWIPLVRGIRYRDGTRGVGAVRDFRLVVGSATEEFVHWESGKRAVYAITEAPLPGLALLVEDYHVEHLSPRQSSLTWSVGMTPRLVGRVPLRWLAPAVSVGMGRAVARVADLVAGSTVDPAGRVA